MWAAVHSEVRDAWGRRAKELHIGMTKEWLWRFCGKLVFVWFDPAHKSVSHVQTRPRGWEGQARTEEPGASC